MRTKDDIYLRKAGDVGDIEFDLVCNINATHMFSGALGRVRSRGESGVHLGVAAS